MKKPKITSIHLITDKMYLPGFFSLVMVIMLFISDLKAQVMDGGFSHSMILCNDSTVWTCGWDNNGQLGNGPASSISTPAQVGNLSGVIAVSGGPFNSMVLRDDGTVWTWGDSQYGQLGNGSLLDSDVPVQVTGLTNIIAIAANYHCMALRNDGTVWAWGHNNRGQLGDGTTARSTTPIQVSGLTNVIGIAVGGHLPNIGGHSMALLADSTVWTWGLNSNGQLGIGSTVDSPIPVQVSSLTKVVTIVTRHAHAMALKDDGTVWTWGKNAQSQLGDGTTQQKFAPVQVLDNSTAIACGIYHSIALRDDSTVWAWGYNGYGQLGNGSTSGFGGIINNPAQVLGLANIIDISAQGHETMALKDDRTVWSCGINRNGQLGDGTIADSVKLPIKMQLACTVGTGITTNITASEIVQPILNVYPNPNTGKFTLMMYLQQNTRIRVKLYQSNGQMIFSKKVVNTSGNYKQQIDLSSFAKGIYYIQIVTNEETYTRKLVYQ